MDKLDHLGWVVSSSYAIGDVRFAVRSTSLAFGAWLSETLRAHEVEDVEDFLYSVVVPEAPADGSAKEFCILYKGSTAIDPDARSGHGSAVGCSRSSKGWVP